MTIHRNIRVASWIMYDFANVLYSMNIISLYFALWVTVDMKGEDILYSLALSISMLCSAISAPILGAASDQLHKRMPFFITLAVSAAILTSFIGTIHSLFIGLLFFSLANYCYQLAEVFYNALLPSLCEDGQVGRLSGYGIGFGYFGTIAGLLLVKPFVLKHGYSAAFFPTAFYYLLFSLPCFLFVKDVLSPSEKSTFHLKQTLLTAYRTTKDTLYHIKQFPGLLDFFMATFIALNAVSTIYIFMSVYIKKVIGFSDAQMIMYYMICSVFAIVGSIMSGFVTDHLGAKKTLSNVFILWCIVLLLAIFSFHPALFWIVGPLAGISLGATWTSARTLVVHLSPKEMIGEIFGFYGLIGRTSSIAGPLVWGACVYFFKFAGVQKYRIALFILLIFIVIGWIILQRVPGSGSSGQESGGRGEERIEN